MPCMGPDLGEARKRGNEIGRLMFFELVNKHNLLDISDPKYDSIFMLPGAKKRWEYAKELFIRSVEEIFVEDAANGF